MNTKSAQRCAALLGLVLALAGCSSPKAPQVQTDPYANGQTYPWALADTGKVQTLTAGSNALQYSSLASASNAWGPIEQNTSNGDQAAGDGQPLTIGGKVYTQGFGTHAGSQMLFTLAPASNITCTTFTADVGVDDEVGSKGSVVFQVYADGVKKYDSGSLTGADAAKAVSVDVTGVKQLKLVVTDAGDGIDYDHADWANPNVNCTGTGTDQAPAAPANLTATPAQSGFTLNWSASNWERCGLSGVAGLAGRWAIYQAHQRQPDGDHLHRRGSSGRRHLVLSGGRGEQHGQALGPGQRHGHPARQQQHGAARHPEP